MTFEEGRELSWDVIPESSPSQVAFSSRGTGLHSRNVHLNISGLNKYLKSTLLVWGEDIFQKQLGISENIKSSQAFFFPYNFIKFPDNWRAWGGRQLFQEVGSVSRGNTSVQKINEYSVKNVVLSAFVKKKNGTKDIRNVDKYLNLKQAKDLRKATKMKLMNAVWLLCFFFSGVGVNRSTRDKSCWFCWAGLCWDSLSWHWLSWACRFSLHLEAFWPMDALVCLLIGFFKFLPHGEKKEVGWLKVPYSKAHVTEALSPICLKTAWSFLFMFKKLHGLYWTYSNSSPEILVSFGWQNSHFKSLIGNNETQIILEPKRNWVTWISP